MAVSDRQNTVLATTLAGIILVTVFFCPWRVETSRGVAWSPIYQQPMSYVQSDEGQTHRGISQIEYDDGEIAIDLLLLQVLAVAATGGVLYVLTGKREDGDDCRP